MGAIKTEWVVPRETVNLVSRGTLRFQGKKINCFQRDQFLSYLFYNPRRKTFSCTNLWKKILRALNIRGNSALLPSDVIDFELLPTQRFWRETVSLLDVMWPRSNQWERALLGKISSCLTTQLAYPGNKWWFFLFSQGNYKPVSCVILFTYVQIFYTFQLPELFQINLGF